MDNHPFFIMGLFSKTRIYTYSQTVSLIEDTPDVVKQSVTNSILGNKEIVPNLMDTTLNRLSSRVNRYYKYGITDFTNGLPEGSFGYFKADADAVIDVLTNYILTLQPNEEVSLISYVIGEINPAFYGFKWLRENTDWNYEDNYVTTVPGISTNNLVYIGFDVLTENLIKLNFNEQNDLSPEPNVYSIQIPAVPSITDELYYMVTYNIVDKDTEDTIGNPYYWVYNAAEDIYVELKLPEYSKYTQYLPIVPVRVQNQDMLDPNLTTDLYRTSVKILKYVDIDANQLREGINASPDIGSLDHAYFVFGYPIRVESDVGNEYLYEYFNDLHDRNIFTKTDFDNWLLGETEKTTPPINVIKIEDDTYKTNVVYYYITREIKVGNLTKIGKVIKEVYAGNQPISYEDDNFSYTTESPDNRVILKKQITMNTYSELTITGLVHYNTIYGVNRDEITTLDSTNKESFIIPLNISIINQMKLWDRDDLYYKCFNLVLNAYEQVKLKWYETGIFKVFTIVLVIAISIYTGGAASFITGLISAATAGVLSLGLYLAEVYLISSIIRFEFEKITEALGIELAFIIGVLLVIGGSFASLNALPNADTLLNIGTGLGQGVNQVIQEEAIGIQDELTALQEYYGLKFDELSLVQEELQTNKTNILDPIGLYTDIGMFPNESSEMYLQRKIELVNPGILTIDAVSNFVDNMLTLRTS